MKTELYFSHCQTTTEVKKLYRELALVHHPDRGGDTVTMQVINKQYQEALKRLDGKTETGTDGKERTYTYNPAKEEEIANKLQELLSLNLEWGYR